VQLLIGKLHHIRPRVLASVFYPASSCFTCYVDFGLTEFTLVLARHVQSVLCRQPRHCLQTVLCLLLVGICLDSRIAVWEFLYRGFHLCHVVPIG
jgi:hypothetical protein